MIMKQIIQVILNLFAEYQSTPKAPKAPKVTKKGHPKKIADIAHIKQWEGLRLKAYMPTAHDVWTIGYGHTRTAKAGMVITEGEAERLLRSDLKWVEDALHELVDVPLSQKQFDALAGLVFNIGAGAFARSTVLKRLNAYDYVGAAEAMMMWVKQRQNGRMVTLKGLVRRRSEEKRLFLEGTDGHS
jgi:GH24 family phage-related lysozyme (muramidase)